MTAAKNLSINNFHMDKVPSKVGYDLMSGLAATVFWIVTQCSYPENDMGVRGGGHPWMKLS